MEPTKAFNFFDYNHTGKAVFLCITRCSIISCLLHPVPTNFSGMPRKC